MTFAPGVRTHPLGQTLITTSGLGWAQRDGGPVEEIRPRGLVPAKREALARGHADHRDGGHIAIRK